MGKKMGIVKECDVPVVDEDYLDKAASGAALLKIPGSTISDWGAPRHSVSLDSTQGSSKEEKSFKSQGQEGGREGGKGRVGLMNVLGWMTEIIPLATFITFFVFLLCSGSHLLAVG